MSHLRVDKPFYIPCQWKVAIDKVQSNEAERKVEYGSIDDVWVQEEWAPSFEERPVTKPYKTVLDYALFYFIAVKVSYINKNPSLDLIMTKNT